MSGKIPPVIQPLTAGQARSLVSKSSKWVVHNLVYTIQEQIKQAAKQGKVSLRPFKNNPSLPDATVDALRERFIRQGFSWQETPVTPLSDSVTTCEEEAMDVYYVRRNPAIVEISW